MIFLYPVCAQVSILGWTESPQGPLNQALQQALLPLTFLHIYLPMLPTYIYSAILSLCQVLLPLSMTHLPSYMVYKYCYHPLFYFLCPPSCLTISSPPLITYLA